MHAKYLLRTTAHATSPNTFRTGLVLLLAAAMLGILDVRTFAQGTETPGHAAVASQVKKFGVGKSVKVWLVGGEQVKGHIQKIGEDSFTVKVNRSTERSISYAQVETIRDPSSLEWLLIGAAIVVVVLLIFHH